ncbi:MAG: hypothetical protein ICV63_00540 [Coleofasciculus sp. Co-bin14]|nr:hypothetical protein [Coleofasciculus sp. Co-bin14]
MNQPEHLPLPNLPDNATLDQWAEEAIRLGHNEAVIRIVQLVGEGKITIGDGFTAAMAVKTKLKEIQP